MIQKKINLLVLVFALLIVPRVFAQSIIDVPTGGQGAITTFLLGDTLSNGDRAHPNALYRLQRGAIYFMDKTMNIDFNLNLIADDDDPNNPTRPPMIARGITEQGDYLKRPFEITTDNVEVFFKNIILNGAYPNEEVPTINLFLFKISGDNIRIESNHCIYNAITGMCYENDGLTNFSLILKNNIFRNNAALNSGYSGDAYVGTDKVRQDSIIFHNNTFFNVSAYMIYSKEYISTFEFMHNTIFFTSRGSLRLPNMVHGKFEDNLIYNYQSTGQDSSHWVAKHYAMVQIRELDSTSLADAGLSSNSDRVVEYRNNVHGYDQRMKQFLVDYNLHNVPWMGPLTDSLFGAYDNFVNENNIENDDPGFDAALVTALDDLNIPFNIVYRTTKENYPPRFYTPNGKIFDIPWPLPENLAYTNTALQTHAGGNLPVGDLNWWPAGKIAEWEAWRLTGVEKEPTETIPSDYTLSQNYPNPFNPTTEMNFSIPVSGNTTLAIYNVLGQKVATLVNAELSAGSYKYQFDASNLSSGIYFYKLQSNNYSAIKKMMLLK